MTTIKITEYHEELFNDWTHEAHVILRLNSIIQNVCGGR